MPTDTTKKYFRILLILTVLLIPFIGYTQTASELQTKIDAQNKAISDLEAEIAGFQRELNSLGQQKDTLANAVKILNLESQKIGADIKVTQNKIESANLKLDSLGQSINNANTSIDDLKIAIGKSLREMNTQESTELIEVLVAERNLNEIWHHAAAQLSFRNSLRERIDELSNTKQVLIVNKDEAEKAKNELLGLQSQLRDQQAINQKYQSEKNTLLKNTKNQESTYAKLVADKQKLKTQLESELRDYESKLKYVLDPKSLPTTGSTTFIWPLDKYRITQLFGKTVAAQRLYTSGSHNGIDFGVPTGTPVKAMASGTVVASGNADLSCKGASYGVWVFIKYDNGLASVYGHLSLAKVSGGERVRAGEIVAYSGATGYATGPHLHVSVFPNDAVNVATFASKSCPGKSITIPTAAVNAYLDPMQYLPKS